MGFDREEGAEKRVGLLRTKSGVIQTPFFMPDATRASVRGVGSRDLRGVGIFPMVVNTYHLYLQPGMERIRKMGGVHKFMNWDGPLLSDSGGYQVYSLIHKNSQMGKITEEGAIFRSVLDGSRHLLTPERAIEIQFDLGVDMMVVLDDPRPNSAPRDEIDTAVERTIRWAKRCQEEYDRQCEKRNMSDDQRPLIFSVIQGGKYKELRKRCIEGLREVRFTRCGEVDRGWDGYGFGARHVDEDGVFMDDIMEYTASIIPEDALRFALGVGNPEDIVRSYAYGWDMFDCVIPSREGRHGRLFVWENDWRGMRNKESADWGGFYKTMNISNGGFKEDGSPISEWCDCYACSQHSLAYIHHLFRVKEPLGPQLATIHNLRFYMQLMESLRESALLAKR